MLCAQILSPDYPTLQLNINEVQDILRLHSKKGYLLFPLLNDEHFTGLLSYEAVKNISPQTKLSSSSIAAQQISVNDKEHFLFALKLMSLTQINVLPVTTSEGVYCGTITQTSLLNALAVFNNISENTGALIVLQMHRSDYSFSELSRLIESNDASIMQLNTYFDVQADNLVVTIRINKTEVSDIISTLQRYDYLVTYFWGNELYENELKRNYEALMNYLSI